MYDSVWNGLSDLEGLGLETVVLSIHTSLIYLNISFGISFHDSFQISFYLYYEDSIHIIHFITL